MKKYLKICLIIALFLVSLSGLGLHYKLHPLDKNLFGYVPFIAGLVSVLVIPTFFMFRKTLHLAYLLNGFMVILGVITMAHYTIVKTLILPDIFILLAKYFIGRVIFCIEVLPMNGEMKLSGWNWFRYPNDGFFVVHAILLSVVYMLGNILWR